MNVSDINNDKTFSLDKTAELPKKGWADRVNSKLVKKVSLVALGILSLGTLAVVGGSLLAPGGAGSAAVGGASLMAVASENASMSSSMAKVGAAAARALAQGGRYLFYAFAVPTYGLSYALPHWVTHKILPQVAAKVAVLAPYIQNAALWTSKHVAEPMVKVISQVGSAVAKHVLIPAFHALHNLAQALGPHIEKALATVQPLLKRGAEAIVRVATPAFNALGKALNWAGPKVGQGVAWSFKHVIIPGAIKFFELTSDAIAIASNIGTKVASVALKVHQYVLAPLMNNVLAPAFQMSKVGFNATVVALRQAAIEAAAAFHSMMGTVKAVFA